MMQAPKLILKPGEDSRIDVQRDLNGGILFTITTPRERSVARLDPQTAIKMALAILEGCGIPIEEAYRRQQAAKAGMEKAVN